MLQALLLFASKVEVGLLFSSFPYWLMKPFFTGQALPHL